jgi:hypothetical protein
VIFLIEIKTSSQRLINFLDLSIAADMLILKLYNISRLRLYIKLAVITVTSAPLFNNAEIFFCLIFAAAIGLAAI